MYMAADMLIEFATKTISATDFVVDPPPQRQLAEPIKRTALDSPRSRRSR